MKKIVTVTEIAGEGLEALMGEKVLLLCANYFYAGVLTGVNQDFVLLTEPSIVYETGAWSDSEYADAQRLPGNELYVHRHMIESYLRGK